MRAVVQREWGSEPEMTEIERPEPCFGEVLVRVVAAGVNPVDHYTREGLAYNDVLSLPFVHGWDVAGVVERVAYGVTRFAPGDRVFGMPRFPHAAGAYADYLTAPTRHLAHMPDTMTFTEGAALPLAALTAWQMLVEIAEVSEGQRVLISAAAGGVGHLAVQIAKARGAFVIGTAQLSKHTLLYDLGVDEAIDYTTHDVSARVHDVDAVVQMIGGDHALRALECLKPGGVLVNAQAAWTPGMHRRARELGVRAHDFLVEPDAPGLEAVADLFTKGMLTVRVSDQRPLAEAAAVLDDIASGRTVGKIVLTVNERTEVGR